MNKEAKFVVCIENSDYPASLEKHKIYQVVSDEAIEDDGELRVIDESGEDYIYPSNYFVAVSLPSVIQESVLRAA